MLDRVPAIAPLGVRNAAQGAPGRMIAGPAPAFQSLAQAWQRAFRSGRRTPSPRRCKASTVTVDDTFLPLIFVSPQQINAQMVSSIKPGIDTLVVRGQGQPEDRPRSKSRANAPGLFSTESDGVSFGVFVRANGQAVTREMPAQPGETLSLFWATGLGSYRQTPPDSVPVSPESSAYSTADPVDVLAGGERLTPLYAGRASAGVGVPIDRD